ncbi:MAG: hypothetical protein NVSMB13_21020 [Mycobacteriales bacterium]
MTRRDGSLPGRRCPIDARDEARRWAFTQSVPAGRGAGWLVTRAPDHTERWVAGVIERGRAVGVLPRYGSDGWFALAPNDPRRLAALVLAAEAWRTDGTATSVARRFLMEMVETKRLKELEDERAHAQVARGVRALATIPPVVSTADRIAAARAPRPGDYCGGSVSWGGDAA